MGIIEQKTLLSVIMYRFNRKQTKYKNIERNQHKNRINTYLRNIVNEENFPFVIA